MNKAIDEMESKIREFKEKEDYKLAAYPEKKVYTIFNEELKKLRWDFLRKIVEFNIKNPDKYIPVSFIEEAGKSTIQIGETVEEKKERERQEKEQKKKIEKIRKEHERIIEEHEKIVRESKENEKILEENKEQEKIFEQWKKEDGKCHICGKEAGSNTVSFKDKQGKLTITCSLECWKKGFHDHQTKIFRQENQQQNSSQINQPAFSPSSYLPWIIGGIMIFSVIGIIILFTKKRNK